MDKDRRRLLRALRWRWLAKFADEAMFFGILAVQGVLAVALGFRVSAVVFVSALVVMAGVVAYAGWWLHTWSDRHSKRTWDPPRGPRDR
jgi:protein-S-isoprenylcysteine O-methyltransferase Ste14